MYRIEILKAAAFDLKDSSDWYELRQQGLGRRFQKCFCNAENYSKEAIAISG